MSVYSWWYKIDERKISFIVARLYHLPYRKVKKIYVSMKAFPQPFCSIVVSYKKTCFSILGGNNANRISI